MLVMLVDGGYKNRCTKQVYKTGVQNMHNGCHGVVQAPHKLNERYGRRP